MFKSFTTSQTKPTSYREEIIARKRLYRPYVSDGLKVYYDWNNRACKEEGQTRSYNLVQGSPAETTLIEYNSPQFITNDRFRYLRFDGLNDVAIGFWDRSSNSVTIEMVARLRQTSNGMFCSFSDSNNQTSTGYDIWQGDSRVALGFNSYSSDVYGISTSPDTLNLVGTGQDNWKHYIFHFAPVLGDSKIYINSNLQSMRTLQGDATSKSMTIYEKFSIGAWTGNNWFSYLDVAEFKLYDRELSAREVAYNYGVAKSRKGV